MPTLSRFAGSSKSIPTSTAWLLADLGEAKGRQDLFAQQAPQRLKALREHALIESAVSSNRIEGVEIDPGRVGTVIFGKPLLKDRNEEEIHGYREALRWIHRDAARIPVTTETMRKLHGLVRAGSGDAGEFKARDGDIIERYPDGSERVRFRTVPAKQTSQAIDALVRDWARCLDEKWVHPLVALAAFNLDFLCIHPFRDGNGRVSRLLLLLGSYHLGLEVGRYISLERLIEQNRERYYETLEESSRSWHEGRHDPWPYTNYLLFILKTAYKEFEKRVGQVKLPRGAKTERIEAAIREARGAFRISELQRQCPGVSVDLVRRTLKRMRREGAVECLGRGPRAQWRKTERG